MLAVLALLTASAAPVAPAVASDAAPAVHCATMDLLDGAWLAPELFDRAPAPPLDKQLRDSFGVPASLESENFVIRWGSGVDTADAQTMLDAFERSWDVEVVEMAHPAPPGADTHKFNVYVGSTGGGTPSDYGAAGYFNTDDDGWPMIVLNPSTVANPASGVATVAHEFYHSVQYGTQNYGYADEAAWFWEATASWIEVEVFPDNSAYVVFLFGYAMLPHLELNFFDYPDRGELQEYHQYGAFIWPRYLAEYVGDWRIVRNAWVAPQTSDGDPLEALRAEVADLDVDLDVAFMDFAARNVTWDYAHGDWYAAAVANYVDYFPGQDARIVHAASAAGTDGPWSPSASLRPRRYGVNVVSLVGPDDGDLVVDFRGDTAGSDGDAAHWALTLVRVRDDVPTYEVLLTDGTELATRVSDVGGEDALYVVVGARSDALEWDETFDYEIDLSVTDQPEGGDDTGEPGGDDTAADDSGGDDSGAVVDDSKGDGSSRSGCSTGTSAPVGSSGALGAAMLLAMLGLARRRE
jgi:hypothetical protein